MQLNMSVFAALSPADQLTYVRLVRALLEKEHATRQAA